MSTKTNNNSIIYLITALATLTILLSVLYSHNFHLSRLINYGQDNISHGALVKNFIEHGFTYKNTMLGAPKNYDLSDYPFSDSATILILRLLSLVSHNFVVVINLFFILTFPLTAVISLFVFRTLGLITPFAFAASLLFSFIPYHFFRMEEGHLFLEAIYAIPIYVYFIFYLLNKPQLGVNDVKSARAKKISLLIFVLAGVFAASSGIYYAYFACFFILLAGILVSFEKKQWSYLIKPAMLIILIGMTLIANAIPYITTRIEQGPNYSVWNRDAFESEVYGLKISQLMLPTDRHQLPKLAAFKNQYNATAPLVNENATATLGIFGSIGFIFLFLILFFKTKMNSNQNILFDLSRLTFASVMLAIVGGLGSILAYLSITEIRAYNRISVFIAFFSLTAFFLVVQSLLKPQSTLLRYTMSWILALTVIGVGIIDQIPKMSFSNDSVKFESDSRFVAAIEAAMPQNTMIMQLPFMEFPESPGIVKMTSYDHLRPYLFSKQLRWSFGAIKGRGASVWQEKISKLPIKSMLNELIYAGFTGLYINRNGYLDNGLSIQKQLSPLLKNSPIINENNDLLFYDLRPYAKHLQQSLTENEWQSNVARLTNTIDQLSNILINWGSGLYQMEQANNTSWHWSQAKSQLDIYVPNHASKVNIKFIARSGYPDSTNLKLTGDLINENIKINQLGTPLEKQLILAPGIHHIYFKTDAKQVAASQDWRQLYFAIYDFSLTTV